MSSSEDRYPNEDEVTLMPEIVSNPLSHHGGLNINYLEDINEEEEEEEEESPRSPSPKFMVLICRELDK
ncbi:unnamed protein product [Adineta steineri]|uniref:Uncharacterized protein n=1 Tax=Adineta steineri TaxID=433720 RepID=A0A819WRX0_9BILA|nr:unnamed protein product [Adineta steineri]